MNQLPAYVVLGVFCLGGCASIVSKSDWPVTVSSNPAQAKITITNEKGVAIYTGTTPATVVLKAGESYFKKLNYTVAFEKEGFRSETMALSSHINGWYFGNFVFGGLIGMLVVDPITGAMWKLDSPNAVNLAPNTSSLEQGDKAIQIVLLSDVPENLRDKMVRIK